MSAIASAPRRLTRSAILARLNTRFSQLTERSLWLHSWSGLCWALVAAVVASCVAGWIDLLIDLPPLLRLALLLAGFAAPIVACAEYRRRSRPSSGRRALAQRLDELLSTKGQVAAGVDLARAPDGSPPLTQGLAALAVYRAAELASAVAPHRAVPTTDLKRSAGAAAAAIGLVLVVTGATPRLVWTEAQRFFDPFGDHPPYSRLQFEVTPGDIEVIFGDRVDIHAVVRGPNPERVELVVERSAAPAPDRPAAFEREVLPMFPQGTDGWRTTLAQVTEPGRYFVRSGSSRSRRHQLGVVYVPEIEQVDFRIEPPAYTRRMAYEGPLPQQGLSGLPGTVVTVRARSNRPLARGQVNILGEAGSSTASLLPSPEDPHVVGGSFTITQAGRIEVHVFDTGGRSSRTPFPAPVTLLTDQPPLVRLLEPQPVSFATPDAVLPVVLSAEDDYGLSSLELYRNLNHSSYRAQSLSLTGPPPTRAHEVVLLPLGAYRLQPGDELRVFARVADNDPAAAGGDAAASPPTVSGKGAESPVAVVRIIARADYERMRQTRESLETLLSKYQQAQRRMETLQEELESLRKELEQDPADSPLSDERQEQLERLQKRLESEAAALERLAKSMSPFDLDRQLSPELERLSQRLAEAAQDLAQPSPGKSAAELRERLAELSRELREQKQEFDDAVQPPLELLAQIFPLQENEARFVELTQRQRDFAERLQSLRDEDNPDRPETRTRLRDLEAEQRALREELAELLQQIRENADRLPEDERLDELRESAQEFAEAVQKSGALAKMGEAEQGLGQFSGSTGHAAAQAAAEILEKFLSQCRGMGQAGKSCLPKFQPGLSQSLAQTIDQLLAQMGLNSGPNSGQGAGAGGGYSAQRSTAHNVGLYGNDPHSAAARARRSSIPGHRPSGSRSPEGGSDDSPQLGDGGLSFRRRLTTGGASDLAVPPRYRDRVGRYFQRLADELGDR